MTTTETTPYLNGYPLDLWLDGDTHLIYPGDYHGIMAHVFRWGLEQEALRRGLRLQSACLPNGRIRVTARNS